MIRAVATNCVMTASVRIGTPRGRRGCTGRVGMSVRGAHLDRRNGQADSAGR